MKINDDHMYHGAALTQIAEHPVFKAINAFWSNGRKSSCAFRINDSTGIYIKYAGAPRGAVGEYVFTFTQPHLEELRKLREHCSSVFAVLVCIGAKAICVLSYGQVMKFVKLRQDSKGEPEEQYQIMVTAPPNKQFRAYVNKPNRKGLMMGATLVARNAFPEILFADQQ
jgi:Rad3-related DNA helicase